MCWRYTKGPITHNFPSCAWTNPANNSLVKFVPPLATRPGSGKKVDDGYVRHGVGEIFMAVEPLAGRRHVCVTASRTKKDWAHVLQDLLEQKYPQAKKLVLVMDNLNTHTVSSFNESFPAKQARQLSARLEIHYTPKHGSWLHVAEIELSVLKGNRLMKPRI